MASGSFGLSRTGDTSRYIDFWVNWSSSSNGSVANSSTVYVDVIASKSSSSTSDTWGTYNVNVNVDGTTHSLGNTSFRIHPGQTMTLYSTNFTVSHNGDGKKTTYIGADVGGDVMWGNGSAYGTLDTIPRASEISSVSTANIGENATIIVNRKSSSFTHTIEYTFGSVSSKKIIVEKSSNTTINWTIPTLFYSKIPNSKEGTGTLYITTYNGNSQIGNTQSKQFRVTTNEAKCKPDISASIKDINQDTLALTGNELYIIKNYSTVQVTYEATPKNSASISQVDVNKRIMSASPYTFTASESEKNEIVITAKDSRGYTSSKQLDGGTVLKQSLLRWTPDPIDGETIGDYVFIDYISPTAKITATRKAPTSDELLISFSGNYFNDTFGDIANVLTLSWKYREYKSNPTDWNDITAQTLVLGTDYVLKGNSYHSGDNADYEEEISLGHLFDYRKNYEIQFIYSDKLEKDRNVTSLGIKGIPIVNWSDDFFNVNGDIRQYNKSILQPSACKMITNGNQTVTTSGPSEFVNVWQSNYEYGDYETDIINNQLIVRNTTICQISGALAGNGYVWARVRVYEADTEKQIEEMSVLMQPFGNEYFTIPLQTMDLQLNPEKTYYIRLMIGAYRKDFNLNDGFGSDATWISARKIY